MTGQEWIKGIIAVVSVVGVLGIAGGLFFVSIPDDREKYFLIILTFLLAKTGTIYDYLWGSSQSSSDSKKIIQNLTAPTNGKMPAAISDLLPRP